MKMTDVSKEDIRLTERMLLYISGRERNKHKYEGKQRDAKVRVVYIWGVIHLDLVMLC